MSGGGDRERNGNRSRLGASVNLGALQGRLAANPARNVRGGMGGQAGTRGGDRERQAGSEPSAAPKPVSQGPSGVDTGGAGTDPASMVARASSSAVRARRMRLARGGGLSNVLMGGATLG
jgi:hypothetical protein